jgi:hypothetical protein
MAEEKTESTSKLQSRKFLVWMIWCIIAVANIIIDGIVIIVTRSITAEMVSLTEKVLGWFFAISMMYLGMNVTQKVGYAVSNAIGGAMAGKAEEEPEEAA